MMQQQQMQMEQQRQQEEYMRQQMMLQQQQSLIPQHTSVGSNNPFAPRPPQQSLLDSGPSNQQQQNNDNNMFGNSFLPVPTQQPNQNQQQPGSPSQLTPKPPSPAQPAWQAPVKKDDGAHSNLANLIGRGREDGIDTFGNIGNLRECFGVGRVPMAGRNAGGRMGGDSPGWPGDLVVWLGSQLRRCTAASQPPVLPPSSNRIYFPIADPDP